MWVLDSRWCVNRPALIVCEGSARISSWDMKYWHMTSVYKILLKPSKMMNNIYYMRTNPEILPP